MKTLSMHFECKCFNEKPSKEIKFILNNPKKEEVDYQILLCGRRIKSISIFLEDNITISNNKIFYILDILKFLMIFHGAFPKISSITIDKESKDVTARFKNYLLKYFLTDKSFIHSSFYFNFINNYESAQFVLFFKNWLQIKDELEITHNLFLYSISEAWPLIDIRNIFLIQVLEPLYEMIPRIKENNITVHETFKFAEEIICATDYPKLGNGITKAYRIDLIKDILKNSKNAYKHTSLKEKLDFIIRKYGSIIFQKEIKEYKYELMLALFVNSRNRLAHIKPNVNTKDFLSGNQCYPYNLKLYLLYRVVLMSLIGVEEKCYINCLSTAIELIDNDEAIL
ncbi:hypothetical protein OQJ13_07940 [Legionella sp. PATHC035]|uniref:HEPN domain-containing protein n=1 Tax=Legionella sp. PATHC035 TaxID=2992040 RepID=UPI002243D42A|nr:HEPN domain-containing protein [Legionella sp. PATHC035]MCW8408901.1 hypothetical protein [Legionella sp. PATHC035]